MKIKNLIVFGASCVLALACQHKQVQQESTLWHTYWRAQNEEHLTSDLVDYSYAGFDFGESDIPVKYWLSEFDVLDFGAKPDDNISDFESIQQAIDAAEEAGGGVVTFPKGRFLVSESRAIQRSLEITSSNIILKGDQSGGTEFYMKDHMTPRDTTKTWTTPAKVVFKGEHIETELVARLAANIQKGDDKMIFDQVPDLASGDVLLLKAKGTFLNAQLLEGLKTRDVWEEINVNGARVNEYHEVKSVDGKVVTLRAPVLVDVDISQSWRIVKYHMISNCGFEQINFTANFLEPFEHLKNARHDAGYKALQMIRCRNSWVKNCTFRNVSAAVVFRSNLSSTVLKCQTVGNSGHESFSFISSTRCMMSYCQDNSLQWHGPNTSHASVGTVIFKFKGKNSGINLHGKSPRVTLFDQCEIGGFTGDRVGKPSHGAHYTNLPNHLDGLVIWNYHQTGLPVSNFNFWDLLENTPEELYGPLTAVNPTVVGFHGVPTSFDASSLGYIESLGTPIAPASLYVQQLKLRGFDIPDFLKEPL
ncbi:DUF4955 domain-containing protein [Reichenbachiella carrageenanivorans]|uniref:DUF4955 domain-containing protein n=1 Tax=Reichenbachiella carrageenanivorans TaxID=2979869 RepID=A0ABY6CYR9_9BACT|nr:DUF4955 domain-containing protein [Reichenbachiella carrageenanivorans]UXX79066.1 DUF4955 domain-containing protein [Reichenbachiella carrageenanivorans]